MQESSSGICFHMHTDKQMHRVLSISLLISLERSLSIVLHASFPSGIQFDVLLFL